MNRLRNDVKASNLMRAVLCSVLSIALVLALPIAPTGDSHNSSQSVAYAETIDVSETEKSDDKSDAAEDVSDGVLPDEVNVPEVDFVPDFDDKIEPDIESEFEEGRGVETGDEPAMEEEVEPGVEAGIVAAPMAVQNGWVWQFNTWYYYRNGTIVKNDWMADSTGWCYLGADGRALRSIWARLSDRSGTYWYYFKDDCRIKTNDWQKYSTDWRYLGGDGHAFSDMWAHLWDSTGLHWYYFRGCNIAKKFWKKDSVAWCYLDPNNGHAYQDTWVEGSYSTPSGEYQSRWYFDSDCHACATFWPTRTYLWRNVN